MTVSVVIVAYDAGPILVRCLESLREGGVEALQVILVNNGSEAPEIAAARELGFVEVVAPGRNAGFPGGCNLGARHAKGDVLVFLNPDTVVAEGAIRELARTLDDRSIGIAMARLRLLNEPETLNSAGNVVHVAGFAWAGQYGEPVERASELRDVPYASGAAMAIRADLFRELGGFAEELFLYQEDVELGWRVRLRGLRIVMNPRADVYHDYEYARNPRKQYFLERNRLVFVASAYPPRLLAVVSPVLVGTELAMLVVSLREGWLKEKAAGWGWCVRHGGWLLRRRRETQRLRRVRDRDLADILTPVLDPAMVAVPRAAKLLNPLVASYWSLARRLL